MHALLWLMTIDRFLARLLFSALPENFIGYLKQRPVASDPTEAQTRSPRLFPMPKAEHLGIEEEKFLTPHRRAAVVPSFICRFIMSLCVTKTRFGRKRVSAAAVDGLAYGEDTSCISVTLRIAGQCHLSGMGFSGRSSTELKSSAWPSSSMTEVEMGF